MLASQDPAHDEHDTARADDEASPMPLSPRLVAVAGRRALIVSPGGDARFRFAIDGEPVAPARTTVHGAAGLRGLNLLRNGDFSGATIPWRCAADEAGRIGRDIAEPWILAGGHTAYLATDAQSAMSIAYVDADGSDLIPASGGTAYAFRGLFGLHRCAAFVRIEALRADAGLVGCVEHPIATRPGGRSAADYSAASVGMRLPEGAAYLRLTLVVAPTPDRTAPAHLFFTNVHLGVPTADPGPWPDAELTPAEAAAVGAGGWLVEVLLPPVTGGGREIGVFDAASGRPIAGSPIRLAPRTPAAFAPDRFNGVTLAGRLTGMTAPITLSLLIDATAVAQAVAAPDADGSAEVSLRVPDAWLDGLPHDIALLDAEAGTPLYATAEIVAAVLTPWTTYDGAGRAAFPAQDHPLARERYRGLVARLDSLAREEAPGCAGQVARCHAILCGEVLPGDGARLALPAPDDPEVTVFVVGAGAAATAWRCAAALIFAAARVRFEAVLLDPAPPGLDDLVAGFGCLDDAAGGDVLERAATRARGRRAVLLDAGCEPTAGWLDALGDAFARFADVGAVGPKLITPDGRLAEAGRVVWSSGVAEPVTFGGNARDPRAAYARQVDLLRADALMLEAGALDLLAERRRPDDPPFPDAAEIAFGLARAGRRIVYAPEAVVAVGADDPAAAAGGHALAPPPPSTAFRRRWQDVYRHNPPDGSALALALDRAAAGRVLVLDLQLPRPDVDAGSYAADQEIRLFQALGYKVTVLPLNMAHLGTYAAALQRRGVEVLHAPFVASLEAALAARAEAFDVVYMTRYTVARVALPLLRRYQARAKRILNVADLHFLRELRAGLAAGNAEAVNRSRITRDTELGLMREVDLTLTYTDVEATVILSHHLGRTKVGRLPWIAYPSISVPPFAERAHIGFLGSFGHRPNVEAMTGFVQTVMPRLRARVPGLELHIFGSQMTDEIARLAGPGVVVRGHAATLEAVYGTMRAFVAPLVSGAGIKGKVLGAMGHGCPTVLSPIAAEGIGGRAGSDYVLAETPGAWIEGIAALVEDEGRWAAISASGRDLIATAYGYERGVTALRRALESVEIFPPETSAALCGR